MNARDRYDSLISYYANLHSSRVPQHHAKAQLIAESGMNPKAVSAVGARGLAQFMMPTWLEWGSIDFDEAFNPEMSIDAYFRYMDWLLTKWTASPNGIRLATASYNWGIGNVRKAYIKYGTKWESKIPSETRSYIHRIFRSPVVEVS